jgi:hypothetical protein
MHATSYIMTWRGAGDSARKANLDAVLRWLKPLRPAEVILVEQDVAPSLTDPLPLWDLRYVFAYNPGPFNKSWGFNVGARLAAGSVLAFGDADVVCNGLPEAIAVCRAGAPVVRPFRGINDLNEAESEQVRKDLSCLADPGFITRPPDRTAVGEFPPACGALAIFERRFFWKLGGWDERFLGWGGEDDAMDVKVRRANTEPHVINRTDGFHLHHVRATTDLGTSAAYRNNLALLEQLRTMPGTAFTRLCAVTMQLAGDPAMHRPVEVLQ